MSTAAYFDALYTQPDPFQYRQRWYEARKRALTLACLTHERYARAWELGCSNGVMTAALAPRCDALLATDLSAAAVDMARASTQAFTHVRVAQAEHPREWPEGLFDLILISEVGYYLPADALAALANRLRGSLRPGGLLVGCHWRVPFAEACSTTEQVHAALADGLVEQFTYRDPDVLLQAWSTDPTTVAAREGLR